MTAIHLRIVQGGNLIADIPEWPFEVPRQGDYIFHPPLDDSSPEGIAGCVQTVTWRTHDRPAGRTWVGSFVMTAKPYVELVI